MADKQSLSIRYTPNPETLPGKTWAVVEQIPFEPETPSLADAATLLDAAFNYNPCTGETEPAIDENGQLDPALTESEFFQLAGEIAPSGVCLYQDGFTAHIKVYLSDNDITFDFNIDGQGEVTQVSEHTSSVTYTLELDESSSAPLEYPIYYRDTTDPNYDPLQVIDEAGNEIAVTASSDSLVFDSPISGILTVTHDVYIYLHYVLVPCNPLDEELPTPRIIIFYDRLAYDETIVPPQIDTSNVPEDAQYIDCRGGNSYSGSSASTVVDSSEMCTKSVYHYSRCKCSEDRYNSHYEDHRVLCDEWGTIPYDIFDGYVDCPGEVEDVNDPDFYLNTCCEEYNPLIRGALPLCQESTTIFYGGVPFEDEQRWIDQYGIGNVLFIPISPKGEPCGEHKIEWDLGNLDCCGPGLPTLAWYQTHTDLSVGESYIFIVTGGAEPITWSTEAPGITIEASGDTRSARVTVTSCFCEPGSIVATDACNTQIAHGIELGDGLWELLETYDTYSDPSFQVVPWGQDPYSADSYLYDPADDGFIRLGQTVGYSRGRLISGLVNGRYGITQSTRSGTPTDPVIFGFTTSNQYGWAHCFEPIDNDTTFLDPYFGIFEIPVCDMPPQVRDGTSVCLGQSTYNKYLMNFSGLKFWEWVCPDRPPEIVYDDENSADIVAEGGSAWISVQDGEPPYTFEVSGQGFYLNSAHTIITLVTSSTAIKVYANDSCGVCEITVTDACKDVVHGTINSDAGAWDTTCNWIGSYIISINPSAWGSQPYTRNADYCGAGGWGGANSCAALGGGVLQVTQHYTWDPRLGGSWESRNIHLGFICYDSYMDMIEHPDNTIIIDHQDSANRPTQPDSRMQCENYPCTWGC